MYKQEQFRRMFLQVIMRTLPALKIA